MQPHTLMQSSGSSFEEAGGQGKVQNKSALPPPHSTQQPSASTISTPEDCLGAAGFPVARAVSCALETLGTIISKPASNSCTIRSTTSFLYFRGRPFLITPDFGPHLSMQFNACAAVGCNSDRGDEVCQVRLEVWGFISDGARLTF